MLNKVANPDDFSAEQLELKGFSRSITEIEWLLLILVLLYYVSPVAEVANPHGVVASMIAFAAFTFAFQYLNFFTVPARWKLVVETWAMLLFLTWVLWNTGKADSPLLNLYLLVIIASALTLGKLITLLEFVLISAVYFYLSWHHYSFEALSLTEFSHFMTRFAPFLLIAYVTTMLASDVQYGKHMLKLLSETDEMTGLKNKRSFNSALISEIKKSVRYARTFSVMLIDADNLKQINDCYGHDAGDRLIRMLGDTIRDSLRSIDIGARCGGDEFVALLPETSREMAREAGERIRRAVENTSIDIDGNRIATTVSIGISGYPEDGDSAEELFKKADLALYESKQTSRNRVVSYHDSDKLRTADAA